MDSAFEPTPAARTAARHAGLRWVSAGEPGLARVPHGKTFTYRDARGRALRDAATLARIRALAIPPAWQEVWICADPAGHLQATGRDARGRRQYRYHADWQSGRSETKFDGLRRFGALLPRIRARVQRVLGPVRRGADQPTRERVLATLVRLLDTTWLRIGNAAYARENGSYGLSTLQADHAGIHGDQLRLSFVGKSGVRQEVKVADRRVARLVGRCSELPGQELFQYLDEAGMAHRIDSADVNAWLAGAAGQRITAKDFRTWHASVLALDLTLTACSADAAGMPPPRLPDVVAAVARRLGNTPAVCRKAYIHPRVLETGAVLADTATRAALLEKGWAQKALAPRRGLDAAEQRLLGLLDSRVGSRPRPPRR